MAKVRLEAILSAALAGASVTVAIVPEEAGAPRLGHVDGICNWLGPSTIALSNFSDASTYSSYVTRLTDAFGTGVTIVPFPYHPTTDVWEVDGFESASGIYVNFARTQHALYLPTFGLAADADALALVTAHADVPPVAIDARGVAGMGGSVRCLSAYLWGAPADALANQIAPAPSSAPATTAEEGGLNTTVLFFAVGLPLAILVACLLVVVVWKWCKAKGRPKADDADDEKREGTPADHAHRHVVLDTVPGQKYNPSDPCAGFPVFLCAIAAKQRWRTQASAYTTQTPTTTTATSFGTSPSTARWITPSKAAALC